MCPQVRTVRREDNSLQRRDDVRCLYGIKSGDSDSMAQYCRFKAADDAEVARSLDDHSFLFFSERDTKIEVFCALNPEPQRLVVPQGHNIVTIPYGCRAQSKSTQLWTTSTIEAQKITATTAWPQPSAIRALFRLQQERIRKMVTQQVTLSDVEPTAHPATSPAALSAYSLGGLATMLITALSYSHRHRIRSIATSVARSTPATPAPTPAPRSATAATAALYPSLRQDPPTIHVTPPPRPPATIYANFNHHAPH